MRAYRHAGCRTSTAPVGPYNIARRPRPARRVVSRLQRNAAAVGGWIRSDRPAAHRMARGRTTRTRWPEGMDRGSAHQQNEEPASESLELQSEHPSVSNRTHRIHISFWRRRLRRARTRRCAAASGPGRPVTGRARPRGTRAATGCSTRASARATAPAWSAARACLPRRLAPCCAALRCSMLFDVAARCCSATTSARQAARRNRGARVRRRLGRLSNGRRTDEHSRDASLPPMQCHVLVN